MTWVIFFCFAKKKQKKSSISIQMSKPSHNILKLKHSKFLSNIWIINIDIVFHIYGKFVWECLYLKCLDTRLTFFWYSYGGRNLWSFNSLTCAFGYCLTSIILYRKTFGVCYFLGAFFWHGNLSTLPELLFFRHIWCVNKWFFFLFVFVFSK